MLAVCDILLEIMSDLFCRKFLKTDNVSNTSLDTRSQNPRSVSVQSIQNIAELINMLSIYIYIYPSFRSLGA